MRRAAPRRRAKIGPVLALVYLAIPIDLIPDFILGLGHLDDAFMVGWAIRHLIAVAGRDCVARHWKGDSDTPELILRLARVRTAAPPVARLRRSVRNRDH